MDIYCEDLISDVESLKPSGHYYDGYNSFDRKIDEAVCETIDECISAIKNYFDSIKISGDANGNQ